MPEAAGNFSTHEQAPHQYAGEDFNIEKEEQERHAADVASEADKIVGSIYVALDERGVARLTSPGKDSFAELPADLKEEVFKQWLHRERGQCIFNLSAFGEMPDHYQRLIADSIPYRDWHAFYIEILIHFNAITDEKMTRMILSCLPQFEVLAKNREKLPLATDDEILATAKSFESEVRTSVDWVRVIPYIDKFPMLDKNKAVMDIVNNKRVANANVLINNMDKLGITMEQLVGLYGRSKTTDLLMDDINLIEPEYHQRIVDQCLEEGKAFAVVEAAPELQLVDVPELLEKIAGMGVDRPLGGGLKHIARDIKMIADVWADQMPQDVLDALADKYPGDLASAADKFGDRVDKAKLVEALYELHAFTRLVANSKALGLTMDSSFAKELIARGGAGAVAQSLGAFEKLSRDVFNSLCDARLNIFEHLDKFDGVTKDDIVRIVSDGQVNSDNVIRIVNNVDRFDGLAYDKDFAAALMSGGYFVILINNLEKFQGVDATQVAWAVSDAGMTREVVLRLEKFSGLNHSEFANRAIEKGAGSLVLNYFGKFKDLDRRDILRRLLETGGDDLEVAEHFDLFADLKIDRSIGERLVKKCLAHSEFDIKSTVRVSESFKPPIDRVLAVASEMFGDYLTVQMYETALAVKNGTLRQSEAGELGISEKGEPGLRQLRENVAKFKAEILEPDFDAEKLERSDFFAQYFKSVVRYSKSEWGYHDDENFGETINNYLLKGLEGKIQPLGEAYVPSGEVRIAKIEREDQEAFKYSEQFLNRYGTLRRSLEDALPMLEDKKALSHLVAAIGVKRESVLANMEIKLASSQNPKATENLRKRMEDLKGVELRSVKDFQKNFSVLAQFSEFQEELRQLVFYYALKKNKDQRENIRQLTERDTPSFEDISEMVNFVGHITNEETWREHFTDRQALKAFESLVNIRALEEEFARAQNRGTKGTVPMEFVPTRGLLMEFSGHIADACWASKYDSIAARFPNFFSVIMVQNRGTKHERLAGAAMMIETEAKVGRKLLVIRGLNPQENVINGMSVKDFFEKYIAYANEIAKKAGRELAIVIDDHSGGSSTNRPALFEHLRAGVDILNPITLRSTEDTTFNEYDIVDNTYSLSTLVPR